MSGSPPQRRAAVYRSLFGVHVVGEWDYWCAYLDGRDVAGCLERAPDAQAFVTRVGVVGEAVGAALGVLLGTLLRGVTPEPNGAARARAWLLAHGGGPVIVRDDAVATHAWHRARCPLPGIAAVLDDREAMPPDVETSPPWWAGVLGLAVWPPSTGEIHAAYRAAARASHPDAGGSADRAARVGRAYEAAKGWLADREEIGR